MKKTSFLILLFLILNSCFSNDGIKLYKYYTNYLNDQSEVYSKLISYSPNYIPFKKSNGVAFEPHIIVIDSLGKKKDIQLLDTWGFEYNGILYRRSDALNYIMNKKLPENLFYAFIDTIDNNLLYWENATIVLNDLIDVKLGSDIDYGELGHYTLGLEGDFLNASEFSNLVKTFPILNNIAQCYIENSKLSSVAFYIKRYLKDNVSKEEYCQSLYISQYLKKKEFYHKSYIYEIGINKDCINKNK